MISQSRCRYFRDKSVFSVIICRGLFAILEAAAQDPSIPEDWIDVLVDSWPDIMEHEDMKRKLPDILVALSSNVVTKEYADKLRKLKHQAGTSREISALLENNIETAENNVNWFEFKMKEVSKAFNAN